MSGKSEMTQRQEAAQKALRLEFYLRAISYMLELYGKDKFYEKVLKKSDASVTTLIDAMMRYAGISGWSIDDSSNIDYMLGHITKRQSEYKTELNYWFEESALPLMDWHTIIASVRGRMVEGKNFEGKEESMFCAFLAYQNNWIKKFVLSSV